MSTNTWCSDGRARPSVWSLIGRMVAAQLCGALALATICAGAAMAGNSASGALAYHATVLTGEMAGSAYVIADGIAVTNAHVVGRAPVGSLVQIIATPGRVQARAAVMAISPRMDLAVLRVPRGFLPAVPRSNSRLVAGGRLIAAGMIAQPHGAGPVQELSGTVASGVMSVSPFGPGFIAAMPGIRSGFSGGPVLDQAGDFAGMTAALRRSGGAASTRATGAPTEGNEAYILTADAIREEVSRLLRALP